jgi:hypothetical protein
MSYGHDGATGHDGVNPVLPRSDASPEKPGTAGVRRRGGVVTGSDPRLLGQIPRRCHETLWLLGGTLELPADTTGRKTGATGAGGLLHAPQPPIRSRHAAVMAQRCGEPL